MMIAVYGFLLILAAIVAWMVGMVGIEYVRRRMAKEYKAGAAWSLELAQSYQTQLHQVCADLETLTGINAMTFDGRERLGLLASARRQQLDDHRKYLETGFCSKHVHKKDPELTAPENPYK